MKKEDRTIKNNLGSTEMKNELFSLNCSVNQDCVDRILVLEV